MYKSPSLLFLFAVFCLCSCKNEQRRFIQLPASHTGISFTNTVVETDSMNILDVENFYNGGGIGIGDFNNDGKQDIYFAANTASNKLYMNRGDFRFDDVTKAAGVEGEGRWSRGVSVVDINSDGWMDLYVSASLSPEAKRRENLLYINQGADANGIPRFSNMAAEYGLADTSHSTMAAFFDYDNDGDLDMYLLVNEIRRADYPGGFRPVLVKGENPNTDKLFRNDWNDRLQHPFFTNVSKDAGITIEGYGHGVNITDINRDGWKDIYVTNDFISNNILYINKGDGTFRDEAKTYFKHTSENSMGQDVIDINNDGLVDVVEVDMSPEDNYRKKMMSNPISYQRYQNNELYGYQYQYVRNMIQLNQGPRVLENDSVGPPVFSDIGFFSGIAETDWSWTPLVADFDNDGYRDLIITNGFPKDVTDRDFGAFRSQAYQIASKKDILEQIPQIKIPNYAYKNKGDLTFADVTKEWGMDLPTFSNGVVYADLDNDGDLDVLVNNINQEALVYKNNSRETTAENNHFLQISFEGDRQNRNGLGAWAEVFYDKNKRQVYENTPYRGYLSSIQNIAHFGLGGTRTLDSVVIRWPGEKVQVLRNVKADQVIHAAISNAAATGPFTTPSIANPSLLSEVTHAVNIDYVHRERDFIDFNIQKLLPHKFSEYGPGLAVGDVNGDELDDLVSGGSFFYDTQLFLQQRNGTFTRKALQGRGDSLPEKNHEDLGLLLFDADGDDDLDLYIASGGYEMQNNTAAYQDRFYRNDGKGKFLQDTTALPQNFTSKSCIRAADYDHDGDLDLFVAGRVEPWNYPKPVSSFIYRNDSKNGRIQFTDVTASVALSLSNIGLICDAVWTDFDNDGWLDLILAGEWMPVRFLKNKQGRLAEVTAATGISDKTGWWNSVVPGDFDNDGDMDYIVGNLGLNSYYRASVKYPVRIYAKDFNQDGNYDAIPTVYLPSSQEDKTKKEYPAQLRDELAKQMIAFRSKFQNYKSYAGATFDQMFTPAEMKGALTLEANYFSHSLVRNLGNGKFEVVPLPAPVQYSCINGMLVEDMDDDGNLDVLLSGNDYGTEVSVGRYDACNGLLLKGDGKGGFTPLSILQSGWFVPGNAKAVVKFRNPAGNTLVAVSQNRGPLKVFQAKHTTTSIPVELTDRNALLHLINGQVQKRELVYGSSFLSQSGRFITIGSHISHVELQDNTGKKRTVTLRGTSTVKKQ
jgi:hypothetical protein